MTSVQSRFSINQQRNTLSGFMSREDVLILAQNEYARQLRKFTAAQLKQKVPHYVQEHRIGTKAMSSIKASLH
ncbi:uncharacterized protein BX663DRAFT_494898 [Cokeromyces recurvatus]|uniref:uncharacterized protein n=1 Tax=Cokeromyces recurvatus TaxID=90255 RepID=UPI00222101DE|nr:uncharacterized protein BX663DRAFT_494898 [Cokeromyces recurvatus]KAI7907121.1 hypothetical protein BX663DRAFT_494898 [Cokeromyces recurvatus]